MESRDFDVAMDHGAQVSLWSSLNSIFHHVNIFHANTILDYEDITIIRLIRDKGGSQVRVVQVSAASTIEMSSRGNS